MPITMAVRARTEARTPKMMVPVESAFDWVLEEVVVGFVGGYDLRVVLVLSADMVAMGVLEGSVGYSDSQGQ